MQHYPEDCDTPDRIKLNDLLPHSSFSKGRATRCFRQLGNYPEYTRK